MRRALVLAACLAIVGCGFGPGAERAGDGAQLHVTRDFGRESLKSAELPKVRSSDTVMRFLQANVKTTTRYGGGFVQSINGLSGKNAGGRRDWFYFVNGSEAPTGAASRKLSPGDVVQWDYRDWTATPHVPAIVGAFPEPFVHGLEGTRYPTRVECADGEKSCDSVEKALDEVGVPVGTGTLGAEARGGVLRVEVGTWQALKKVQAVADLVKGPATTGVYARFDASGALQLLDTHGRLARQAPPGTGLVAALLPEDQQPLWVVTGVDEAGVARAASLLTADSLRNAYSVAATPSGPVRLPVEGAG